MIFFKFIRELNIYQYPRLKFVYKNLTRLTLKKLRLKDIFSHCQEKSYFKLYIKVPNLDKLYINLNKFKTRN